MNASSLTTSTSTAIRMTGKDALDVLHRIGTRELIDLARGTTRAALFCDFRGRLLHRAWVTHAPDGAVWLLRDDAPGPSLLEHVDKHLFREDVKLEDLSERHRVAAVKFAEWENPFGLSNEPGAVHFDRETPAAIVDAYGFVLVVSPPATAVVVDVDAEAQRIRAGRPKHGHEISERFNPYEVGLAGEVHLSKGCYTGQEALQRLMTYESVKRRLAHVEGEGLPPAQGSPLRAGDREAGSITSAVPLGAGWFGLAAARREFVDQPVELEDGRAVSVAVIETAAPLGR